MSLTSAALLARIAEIAEAEDFGSASSRRSGRWNSLPYVPVIRSAREPGAPYRTQQILGLAFATREEAIARAERVIAARRARLSEQLAEPSRRALRESYGLPLDLPEEI